MTTSDQAPTNPYADPPPPPSGSPSPAPPRNPTHNPYAPPSADVSYNAGGSSGNDESIRNEFLKHEASLRAIGNLYVLSFLAMLVYTVIMLVVSFSASGDEMLISFGLTAFLVGLTVVTYFVATGLRALNPKVKTAATLLSCFGLLGFPLGTLFNIYVLWLLHSAKGKRILTPEYQAIIARTPHIKYRTPLWVWLLLGLFVLALIAIAIIGMSAA